MKKFFFAIALPGLAVAGFLPARAENIDGQSLLEQRCGRCHAVVAQSQSPKRAAPNLWAKLRTFPAERLEFEMSEGMGSRHPEMPQIQFTSEEIAAVQNYLARDP
ncbi:MAG: hypothetical protein B7Y80_09475 [Hyphomicrobium sp. 32-62-53]|nr:MAG: hypothetical protein B7Z29_09245 [Hyphomicrobium sp. 12-62-95]OYX99810.1 MAG: hypothetical protein B7Y80_09475 [Hyphomicrobium sp. 32-62-53]